MTMGAIERSGNADVDFVRLILPHHQAAIEMAKTQLLYGKDGQMRHFEAGAIIKKGDLLYVIHPKPYQADYDRAAVEVDRMNAQLKLAQIELNRTKELRDKNTISVSEFDQKAATAAAPLRAEPAVSQRHEKN